ncbi:MAG: MAPEG family protein [Oscillatoria sp. PMC 1050.18]|nr:MAPEG family protein [Oscillatoria sp. PMC 1050.18]
MPEILLYAIAGAAFLIYVPFFVVAYARAKGGYEYLATPRAMLDKLPDYAQRATWAHQNSFEAFIIFSAAALMAYVTGVDSLVGFGAVIAFLVARLLYSVFYIANIPLGRSLMFGIGSLSSITLVVLSLLNLNS